MLQRLLIDRRKGGGVGAGRGTTVYTEPFLVLGLLLTQGAVSTGSMWGFNLVFPRQQGKRRCQSIVLRGGLHVVC